MNKLSDAESAELIAVLNSQRFVDKAPPQIYATLLAEGTYLCSISTMYRTLERNRQVKERRRQVRQGRVALLDRNTSLPGALHSYDELRRRRTQPLAVRARRIGRIGQLQSKAGAGVRDAALRLIPGRVFVSGSRAVARWTPPE